jgi:tungstate transport system ATP-binding protein
MFCECSDLVVRYGDATVLNVKRLELPAGKIIAVVGPNGAGKTTLLEVLSLLRQPTAGRISLWGRPADAADADLQRKVVMVMHPAYMFRGSVRDNVVYGLHARGTRGHKARDLATQVLEGVGMADRASQSAASLSAGERQRVNLARAVVLRPEALLLDEPTANVDTATIEVIAALLVRLRDQLGTTIVHASPSNGGLQEISDQVVRLAAGRVLGENGK